MTVSQLRAIFSRLLRKKPPSSVAIADVIRGVLRRTEESRIDDWYGRTRSFPPRRPTQKGLGFMSQEN